MSIRTCIQALRAPSESLAQAYQEAQESLLSQASSASFDQIWQQSAQVAVYDFASCSMNRVCEALMNCHEEPTEEQSLQYILDALTREVLVLGGFRQQMEESGRWMPAHKERSPALQLYHQAQKDPLKRVLADMEALLTPVLVEYITHYLEDERIQDLDGDQNTTPRRVQAVSAMCQQLADAGELDRTYAALAQSLEKIDFPRDLWERDDFHQRGAVPTHVRRLLIRDLLAFMASLKVQAFASTDAPGILLFGVLGAAQTLLDARFAVPPTPPRSLRADVLGASAERLALAGIQVHHNDPCVLCQVRGRPCNVRDIEFPEGTVFGEATQTEEDRQRHAYSFAPTVPAALPPGWRIYLDFDGLWHPGCPWEISILDLGDASS